MRRVVVTGMGVISPLGNDVDTLWQNLVDGKCGIAPITKFDTTNFKASLAAEVKDFDPLQYMDKGTARKNDLFCQYAIAAASQAVEDSGIEGKIDPERFGVYVGSGIGGITTFHNEVNKLENSGARRVSPFFIPMMIPNMASGTIAIRYNAQGVCIPIVTACATSTNAIGEAFHAIAHGYADAIITGGSEAAIGPMAVAGFANMQALHTGTDPKRASIPFDKDRSGFVMGEGAASLILEEYEHAKARGAKIYSEICGYGCTCDAYHITSPHPEARGASKAIELALHEAGKDNETAIYINAHGTSTHANDSSETLAIKKALGNRRAKDALISSTKSMTGHMLGAAGAIEAIVCVKVLENGIVPPTIGYKNPDPECDLDYVPNQARKADIKLALSDSLGFGGHNACIAFVKED